MSSKPNKPPRPARNRPPEARTAEPKSTFAAKLRELADELVFVFVIVMFMKMFLVELYKIPTGSMTPTLLGGAAVAEFDVDGDRLEDIVYVELGRTVEINMIQVPQILTFLNDGRMLKLAPGYPHAPQTIAEWIQRGILRGVYDRILVNKFAYWFRFPLRGEVVVFKVPNPPFTREAPIYIKRMIGEPGDILSFIPDETPDHLDRLALDGEIIKTPAFFGEWRYRGGIDKDVRDPWGDPFPLLPWVTYEQSAENPGALLLKEIRVPDGMAFVMGDNTEGSLDSRYWGGVPLNNFKGRAFMRVWPPRRFGMIE